MKTRTFLAGCFLISSVFLSCSRNNEGGSGGEFSNLQGSLLYDFAGKVYQLDLKTGISSVYFSYNSYSFNNWDLSRDGKYRLTSERRPGTIVETRFKLLQASDERVLKEFDYIPPVGNNQDYEGTISPDNSKILISPDYENGIVILDMDGKLLNHLPGINNEKFGWGDEVIWMPDNSLLITFQHKYIFRSRPPFSTLDLVKEMNYEKWGNIHASKDGTKISFYIGSHIYVMDLDSREPVQVTESESSENLGIFSPDDKHLLIGSDYIHAPLTGSVWKMKIIPNDGKKYHLENDNAVITVKPSNETIEPSVTGRSLWIP
ncbi:MAG: hypothetical protein ABW007_22460 [Chitinophagaceae bacterium]